MTWIPANALDVDRIRAEARALEREYVLNYLEKAGDIARQERAALGPVIADGLYMLARNIRQKKHLPPPK